MEAIRFPSICMYWKWTGTFGRIQPFVVVGACFLVNVTIGSLYAVGNIIPYVVSYVRVYSHPKDLRLNTVTYIYASQAVGVGSAMLLGGLLDRYVGPRLVTLLGGLIMTVGALLSYVTIQFSFWWFMFTYGLITGFGLGVLYICPITLSIKWLPKWKGAVSGFVLSGIALGTLVYSLTQTGYINPHNKKPGVIVGPAHSHEAYFTQEELLTKVPGFFLILGVSYAIITLVCSVFLVNPTPNLSSEDLSKSCSESERVVLDSHPKTLEPQITPYPSTSLTFFEAIRKPNFYVLMFLLTIGQTVSSFFNPLYKSFGLQELLPNDHFLTLVVIVGAVVNLLGRILWPLLADFTSYKTAVIFQGAFLSVFLLTFYISTKGGKYMYFVWVCCILFGIGGYVSLFPSAAVKSFGPDNMSVIYGLMASVALTVGSLLAGCVSQVMVNSIEWYGTFFFLSGISCVYFLVSLLYCHKSYPAARRVN